MSEFSVREVEGMRQVRIDIDGETVRARSGALSKYHGRIDFVPRIPRLGDFWRALFTDEARSSTILQRQRDDPASAVPRRLSCRRRCGGRPVDPRAGSLLGFRWSDRTRALSRALLAEPLGRRRPRSSGRPKCKATAVSRSTPRAQWRPWRSRTARCVFRGGWSLAGPRDFAFIQSAPLRFRAISSPASDACASFAGPASSWSAGPPIGTSTCTRTSPARRSSARSSSSSGKRGRVGRRRPLEAWI